MLSTYAKDKIILIKIDSSEVGLANAVANASNKTKDELRDAFSSIFKSMIFIDTDPDDPLRELINLNKGSKGKKRNHRFC